jgi:putative ATP-binding cassette transporter
MGWLSNLFKGSKSVDTDDLKPKGNYIAPEVPRKLLVVEHDNADERKISIAIETLRIPDNQILIKNFNFEMKAGDHVMLAGPSGTGKSTLFKGIAKLWPYGEGSITLPQDMTMMVMPQKPHMSLTDLRGLLSYPMDECPYSDEDIENVLDVVGLEFLKELLDRPDVNGAMLETSLSGGERQRLAFARVFLAKPDVLFLDECTSALDVDWQAKVYEELMERLPESIIVSISHRDELRQYHDKLLTLDYNQTITVSNIKHDALAPHNDNDAQSQGKPPSKPPKP